MWCFVVLFGVVWCGLVWGLTAKDGTERNYIIPFQLYSFRSNIAAGVKFWTRCLPSFTELYNQMDVEALPWIR